MKLFSVEEANRLLSSVAPVVGRIQKCYRVVTANKNGARLAADKADTGGGGMPGGAKYTTALIELSTDAKHLEQLGVQLKDYERGLIDFPHRRDGRVVLLCWQLGEDDSRIEWWHELEAGFAGRQKL